MPHGLGLPVHRQARIGMQDQEPRPLGQITAIAQLPAPSRLSLFEPRAGLIGNYGCVIA